MKLIVCPVLLSILIQGNTPDNISYEDRLIVKQSDNLGLGEVAFSPDGRHVAYEGTHPTMDSTIVVDGSPGRFFYQLVPGSLQYSRDSKRLAYLARDNKDTFYAIIDNNWQGPYNSVTYLTISPDSKRIAYVAHIANKARVVHDSKDIDTNRLYDNVGHIVFSPDSMHLAYVGVEGGQSYMILDDKVLGKYDNIYPMVFRPQGSGWAYVAQNKGKFQLITNESSCGPYDYMWPVPSYSRDKHSLACGASRNGKGLVILDGKEMELDCQYVRCVSLAGNGIRMAAYLVKGDHNHVSIDGRIGESFKECGEIIISPNGNRWAHRAIGKDGKAYVVVDGIKGEPYGMIGHLIFSHDSGHYAYSATNDGSEWYIVVDGQIEREAYDIVGSLSFRNDNKVLAFSVVKGREMWRKIVTIK